MVKDIYLEQIQEIILKRLKGYKFQLFLFGSEASKTSGKTSDIDVAIMPITPLPRSLLSEIREELEESHIPYSVDLADLSRTTPEFLQHVRQEGLIWND
ncbi:hypothetical protein LCGC14_1994340 [marine sediment metagenome]|uniref:Polymerase beta nucleotidyltransferase domain-containing protein n=1 Tax=marine sediment metagenome TaxID=412755 RepID=A0A0F9I281_9ZZZZ